MWFYVAPGVIFGLLTGFLVIYYCDEDFNPDIKEEKRR
jgi:hypothetical protein